MRTGFLPGDDLFEPAAAKPRYKVRECIPEIHSVKVLDRVQMSEVILDEAELRRQIVSGHLRVQRAGVFLTDPKTNRSSNEDERTLAYVRMLSAIEALRKDRGISLNAAYETLRQQCLAGQRPDIPALPGRSHVYRLWKQYKNGLPLHKGNAAKGRRAPRYKTEVRDVVKEKAGLYLQPMSRWTLSDLTEHINFQLREGGVLPQDRKVSRKYVARVIHEDLHTDPDHARMDPKKAIAAKAIASRTIRVEGLFDRVEQDGLHLPWVLETPYGKSTDVWLVHAIDCASSIPVGWKLVIGSARTATTLACIETILFPKAPKFEALGLSFDYDIYSTPLQIVFDNGPEVRSDRITRLSRLGIDAHRLESNHPQHKPFIERLNKSLKVYLQALPGCTRFDGQDGQRDPVALGDPVMTLEEMERWIVRFYFEKWVNNPLERLEESIFVDNEDLGSTPLLRYRKLTEELLRPVPLPTSIDAWRSVVFDWHQRTLSRKSGITYDTFEFRGDRLPEAIRKFGETEVTVLVDVDDFRLVYVLDTDRNTLIPLVNSAVSTITPAYSFVDAKKMLDEVGVGLTAPDALRRDVLNRAAGVPSGSPKEPKASKKKSGPKPADSNKTTRKAREHGAIQQAAANPLPPAEPPLGHPPMAPASEDWASAPPLPILNRKPKKEGQ